MVGAIAGAFVSLEKKDKGRFGAFGWRKKVNMRHGEIQMKKGKKPRDI